MIIGRRSIHDVTAFSQGLEKAARGVIRITSDVAEDASVCSGFLITDSLVIVPAYALANNPSKVFLTGSFTDDDDRFEMELISKDLPSAILSAEVRPVVLRLQSAFPERVLTLGMESSVVDEPMFVLHFPQGMRKVSLSIGRMVEAEAGWLHYDADTEGGSGGGAIFSERNWAVIGMHVVSDHERQLNKGVTLSAMLDALRISPAWGEIAAYHRLADVSVARPDPECSRPQETVVEIESLIKAAVQWSFDPGTLEHAAQVQPLVVVQPGASNWMLKASERQRILSQAGDLHALRGVYEKLDEVISSPGQQVIDRILEGPPYDLDRIKEELLPYWQQAVRWFGPVEPQLPTAVEVNQNLEKRRVRSRLEKITGQDFRGRRQELALLKAWYENDEMGPMVVSGIGGMGKSALVAKFALSLPETAVLLWLDFDRADLAPDDAVSILSLMMEQMALQLPDFTGRTISEADWKRFAGEIGTAIAEGPGCLLVLDGFEVAQHFKQYQEIWEVLEIILSQASNLRVIVSGRAPVRELKLNDRKAGSLPLEKLAEEDVVSWLRTHGIEDPEVVMKITRISRGMPLILRMAVYLVDKGEVKVIEDLPQNLHDILIEGYLYQRILDRVVDPELMSVAREALVLRRLDPQILNAVITGKALKGMEVEDVYTRLQHEISLVDDEALTLPTGGDGSLALRPEVRCATLCLLEHEDQALVRELDTRAVAWYAEQDLTQPENAAELVYHSLRLKNLARAKAAWLPECASLLKFAEEELPEDAKAERKWLREQLAGTGGDGDLKIWEQEAVQRIRSSLSRGLERTLFGILGEKTQRSENSPLIFYDAWACFKVGDLQAAWNILNAAEESAGHIRRDRTVLGALLARELGKLETADQWLAKILADDWPSGNEHPIRIEALAIRSARIRLTIDLQGEKTLAEELKGAPEFLFHELRRILTEADVTLPSLNFLFDRNRNIESYRRSTVIPMHHEALTHFRHSIERIRSYKATSMDNNLQVFNPGDLNNMDTSSLGWHLQALATRRWDLVTTDLYLAEVCEHALARHGYPDELQLSVVASLMPFRGVPLSTPDARFESLDELLLHLYFERELQKVTLPGNRIRKNKELILSQIPRLLSVPSFLRCLERGMESSVSLKENDAVRLFELFELELDPAKIFFMFYVLAPDPLEALCEHLAHPVNSTDSVPFPSSSYGLQS